SLAAARRAFIEAVTIDPKIALDVAYKTPDMSTLLETVRAATAGAGGAAGGKDPPPRDDRGKPPGDPGAAGAAGVDCFTISGLRHRLVESAPRNAPLRIAASLGGDIQAQRVSVFFRAVRAAEFQELALNRDRECTYTGTIPAGAMKGDLLYYYVAALTKAGQVVASSGAPGAPNLIELSDRGAEPGPVIDRSGDGRRDG
ncbi:MAG TPA: hypothetical protein PKU97_15210, partial [Kofleriaceae bacterium]|nr:hypothetical protein [Kofleriaceae bacterium]